MTEAEWLASNDPVAMLAVVQERVTDRKARLFASVCLNLIAGRLDDPRIAETIRILEMWLRGDLSGSAIGDERRGSLTAHVLAIPHAPGPFSDDIMQIVMAALGGSGPKIRVVAYLCLQVLIARPHPQHREDARQWERDRQVQLIREMFGNAIRPVNFNPSWRTSDAVALAQTMYDSREFGAMPILADALQEAGCDNEEVLSHCRDTSLTHIRGCWVVDLVLHRA